MLTHLKVFNIFCVSKFQKKIKSNFVKVLIREMPEQKFHCTGLRTVGEVVVLKFFRSYGLTLTETKKKIKFKMLILKTLTYD